MSVGGHQQALTNEISGSWVPSSAFNPHSMRMSRIAISAGSGAVGQGGRGSSLQAGGTAGQGIISAVGQGIISAGRGAYSSNMPLIGGAFNPLHSPGNAGTLF